MVLYCNQYKQKLFHDVRDNKIANDILASQGEKPKGFTSECDGPLAPWQATSPANDRTSRSKTTR